MIIFNGPGILMVAVALAIASGIGQLAGTSAEGPPMIIAGLSCAAMDLVYRRRSGHRWLHPSFGGSVCFIPVWMLGAAWLVLGGASAIQGRG
jgi:hypothetical protein